MTKPLGEKFLPLNKLLSSFKFIFRTIRVRNMETSSPLPSISIGRRKQKKRAALSPGMNELAQKRAERARIDIPLRTSSFTGTAVSTLPDTQLSNQLWTISSNSSCCFGNMNSSDRQGDRNVPCHTCGFEHVGENDHGNLGGYKLTGASSTMSNPFKSVGPGGIDDQVKGIPVIKRPLRTSLKSARRFNLAKMALNKEIIELQFLHNLVEGFCNDYTAHDLAKHVALWILTDGHKTLRVRRLRKTKDRRKYQTRQEALIELASASLFISCRVFDYSITLQRILTEMKAGKAGTMERKKEIEKRIGINVPAPDRVDAVRALLVRSCKALKLSQVLIDVVQISAEGALELNEPRSYLPETIVAGSIYLVVQVANVSCSKQEIIDATCVSSDAIRKSYKMLLSNAGELLPAEFRKTFSDKLSSLV